MRGSLALWALVAYLLKDELGREKDEPKYIYAWGNNPKRKLLKGKSCKVIARGRMNSVLVEFNNKQREIISRNALRRKR